MQEGPCFSLRKKSLFAYFPHNCLGSFSSADILPTIDGTELTGTVTLIDKGVIHLDTTYAGSLQIKQGQVASFESDAPRMVRRKNGAVMAVSVTSYGGNTIRIRSNGDI